MYKFICIYVPEKKNEQYSKNLSFKQNPIKTLRLLKKVKNTLIIKTRNYLVPLKRVKS